MQYERRWIGIQESLLSNTESNGLAVCGGVRFEHSLVGLEMGLRNFKMQEVTDLYCR
jgi:hypothetical protein